MRNARMFQGTIYKLADNVKNVQNMINYTLSWRDQNATF
jgi:hypothetical protein